MFLYTLKPFSWGLIRQKVRQQAFDQEKKQDSRKKERKHDLDQEKKEVTQDLDQESSKLTLTLFVF